MKRVLWTLLMGSLFITMGACNENDEVKQKKSAQRDGAVLVEVIALDFWHIRSTMQEAIDIATAFGDKVTVQSYYFGTPEGDAFAESHQLTAHTPIVIFVNGAMETEIDGRVVRFYSFPQNTGTVGGNGWTMDDLQRVLDRVTR